MIGGIEAGGTKCVLAIGPSPDEIVASHVIPTRGPRDTVAAAAAWFAAQADSSALGLATFGPVGLDPSRPDWGHILRTPKPGWSGFDFAGALASELRVPVSVETDVNAAALSEAQAAGRTASLACMTVGTGIGVGLVIDGRCVHGTAHPEMGHYYSRRPADDDAFGGVCPFHGECLGGLASGPAILARWGVTLSADKRIDCAEPAPPSRSDAASSEPIRTRRAGRSRLRCRCPRPSRARCAPIR